MKKNIKVLISIAAFCFAFTGFTAVKARAAETRPLFNYFATENFSLDEETGVYTISAPDQKLPRLSSVDAETWVNKVDYSDDTIRFSYRFTEQYETPIMGQDWLMYFSFRNFSGEAPIWVADYDTYLIFYRTHMALQVYYKNEMVASAQESYPSIIRTDEEGDYVLTDDKWHDIEITIDDETGAVAVSRDKGEENEILLNVETMIDGRIKILDCGGYSFSFRYCDMQIKNLCFENSKTDETDDEVARYKQVINASSEEEPASTSEKAKNGCKGGIGAGALFSLVPLAAFALRKKEKNVL
ncbi:MAG: hypothetical protein IJU84_05945 [Clostridia bacterium]|nr:hypothetical protein [Clostridia bacterium]